jgi:glutathione S-transferase
MLPLAAGAAPDSSDAADAATRIRREIDRLQQSLKDRPIVGEDQAAVADAAGDALRVSVQALDAHRLYLALENLGRASDLIAGARMASEKAEAVASGLPAFESLWEETSRALATNGPDDGADSWRRSRAAVRALSEVAAGRVQPLLEGAQGFAVATQPADGLFYLGEAGGQSAFAAFCASLEFPGKPAPFPLRSMLPEMMRLQEKTQAAFKPPRSIDLHPRFIALNSSLKLGLELDATQAYAGSTYEYLEAVRHYGMLDAPPLDAVGQAKVVKDLAAAHARLDASKRDESLAGLFLERAGSQVAHADGSTPSADEWRSARVILDQVLPAYFAARAPASAPGRTASKRSIRMTLVRWPYT